MKITPTINDCFVDTANLLFYIDDTYIIQHGYHMTIMIKIVHGKIELININTAYNNIIDTIILLYWCTADTDDNTNIHDFENVYGFTGCTDTSNISLIGARIYIVNSHTMLECTFINSNITDNFELHSFKLPIIVEYKFFVALWQ